MSNGGYLRKNRVKIIVFSAILLVLLAVVFVWGNLAIKKLLPTEYSEYVEKYSAEFNIDKYLVYAVISTESGFDKKAESSSGALGLMQLLPKTAKWICEKNDIAGYSDEKLFEAEFNIQVGCCYLNYLLDSFGRDTTLAITAYNGGEGNVREWLGKYSTDGKHIDKIPYKETAKYVDKVTTRYEIYKKIYS